MSVVQLNRSAAASDGLVAGLPWREDLGAIASTMARVLRGRLAGWEIVEPSEVGLESFNGFGGGRTYRVTNRKDPLARVAALHVLPETWCPPFTDPVLFDKVKTVQELFAARNISPRRVVEDPDKAWYVDEWVGGRIDDEATLDEVVEIARLTTRVHRIDIGWYDDVRRRHRKLVPVLESAPDDSPIWWYAAKPFFDQLNETMLKIWITAGPEPVTPAGARLVTTHGDVHYRNVIRTTEGLRFIDAEMACVTSAIQDIAYTWTDTLNGCICATDERKRLFLETYLQESGLSSSARDVRALWLDVERCRMVTNHTDVNSLWSHVHARREAEDLGDVYPRLVAIADRATADPVIAQDILSAGFDRCEAVIAVHQNAGTQIAGMPVTVQLREMAPERTAFQINWDGTIQLSHERWRALVLGVDESGRVVLTEIGDTERLIRLRMHTGGVPVTGRRAPLSAPVKLELAGQHAGSALVVRRIEDRGPGNPVEFIGLGELGEALSVHFEADGIVRLAERSHQAFDCAGGQTAPGTTVLVYHNHCEPNQRFVLNPDLTLSPLDSADVVWGVHAGELVLVSREAQWTERLVFSASVAAAARKPGPTTLADSVPPQNEHVLELASHPGSALSLGEPIAGRSGGRLLGLVPVTTAKEVVVAGDHLSFCNGAGSLTLGTTVPDENFSGIGEQAVFVPREKHNA